MLSDKSNFEKVVIVFTLLSAIVSIGASLNRYFKDNQYYKKHG